MDCKRIIANGYGRLAEKLPEYEKGFLEGMKAAKEALEIFKANLDAFAESDIKAFTEIINQISESTVDNAVEWIESEHDMFLISFVDNNHYSIDADGNIVDDGEEDD